MNSLEFLHNIGLDVLMLILILIALLVLVHARITVLHQFKRRYPKKLDYHPEVTKDD